MVNVPLGDYDVSITSDGFRTHTEAGVVITANAVTRVDVGLVLGQVTEQVTVEASAAQLQTEKADNTIGNLPASDHELSIAELPELPKSGQPRTRRNPRAVPELNPGTRPLAHSARTSMAPTVTTM